MGERQSQSRKRDRHRKGGGGERDKDRGRKGEEHPTGEAKERGAIFVQHEGKKLELAKNIQRRNVNFISAHASFGCKLHDLIVETRHQTVARGVLAFQIITSSLRKTLDVFIQLDLTAIICHQCKFNLQPPFALTSFHSLVFIRSRCASLIPLSMPRRLPSSHLFSTFIVSIGCYHWQFFCPEGRRSRRISRPSLGAPSSGRDRTTPLHSLDGCFWNDTIPLSISVPRLSTRLRGRRI